MQCVCNDDEVDNEKTLKYFVKWLMRFIVIDCQHRYNKYIITHLSNLVTCCACNFKLTRSG